MKQHTLRRNLALAACGATLAAGTLGTGIAKATPESDFLQVLLNGGVTVYNVGAAVNRGYSICSALNSVNGEDLAAAIYKVGSADEIPTIDVARLWVMAAVIGLCPWQNHNTRPAAFPNQGQEQV
jgi:hypothetical protein